MKPRVEETWPARREEISAGEVREAESLTALAALDSAL